MADTLARSNSSVEERTSAGRDEGLANDTQGLGSQILLSPDLFRPPALDPFSLRDLCDLL